MPKKVARSMWFAWRSRKRRNGTPVDGLGKADDDSPGAENRLRPLSGHTCGAAGRGHGRIVNRRESSPARHEVLGGDAGQR